MRLALMNIDKFVAVNSLREVTNPILMDRGFHPTMDGILSTDIFGSTTESRKETFAYIKLNAHLLQPLAYKVIMRLDRRIESIIAGTKRYIIDKSGKFVENEEKGETGAEWLYANWDKVKFERNKSNIRNARIKFIELHKRDELFQSKAIVIPAFYRDINLKSDNKGKPSIHKVNQPYCRLIRLANMMEQGDFAFNLHFNRFQMQKTLVEIYDEFKSRVEKKRGLIKKGLLSKTVDYSARLVISATKFSADRPNNMLVDFKHTGVPLSYCISLFTPFFVGWVQNFFQREFELVGNKYPVYDSKTKQVVYCKPVDPLIQFNEDAVMEMIESYTHSHQNRFDPIYIKTTDPKHPQVQMRFKGYALDGKTDEQSIKEAESNPNARAMTLTDLFYLAAIDITEGKHIYITRYPMTDYMGIFPCGISVLSTNDTVHMKYGDKEYKFYPKVEMDCPKGKISTKFSEVLNMQNTYLRSLNGDYDGEF